MSAGLIAKRPMNVAEAQGISSRFSIERTEDVSSYVKRELRLVDPRHN
jgi:hypothetical protein